MIESDLRDQVQAIRDCSSPEDLNHILFELSAAADFDHYQFNLLFPSGLLQTNMSVFSNSPTDWQDYYWNNQLAADDPLILLALRLAQHIFWHELARGKSYPINARNETVMRLRSEYGMQDGVTIPIHNGQGHHGMLHLSCQQPLTDAYTALAQIGTILPFVFNKACELMTPPQPNLSERERECLFWVSEGKTSWEAARILGITERTVNFHLNSAIRKTGCKNRYQAIARNVAAGRLNPDLQRLNVTRFLQL